MFIDPRSCYQVNSFERAFGTQPKEISPCFLDTTLAKESLLSKFETHSATMDDSSTESDASFIASVSEEVMPPATPPFNVLSDAEVENEEGFQYSDEAASPESTHGDIQEETTTTEINDEETTALSPTVGLFIAEDGTPTLLTGPIVNWELDLHLDHGLPSDWISSRSVSKNPYCEIETSAGYHDRVSICSQFISHESVYPCKPFAQAFVHFSPA